MQLSGRQSLIIAALVLACAISLRIPSNPQTSRSRSLFSQVKVPAPVENTLRNACLDCHSNETEWPWYAHAPVASLLVVHDVTKAREHLNFSDWQSLHAKGPEELAAGFSGICENLLSGAMPKPAYVWMHPRARVSKSQIADVCAWTDKAQMDALRVASAGSAVR
jgi:hypothetical protein